MTDWQRFVPDGCEFYQYTERLADRLPFLGAPALPATCVQKIVTVRRKSDGLFFSFGWEDDNEETARQSAEEMAEDVRRTRLGGNRVDLGEANLGQRLRVHGVDPVGTPGQIIVAIDDEARKYKFLGSDEWVDWSRTREP